MRLDTASIEFILFGLAAALVSNFSRSRVWRGCVLLAASLVFIGLIDRNPLTLLPLAGFLLLGYIFLILIQRGWARLLPLAIAASVLVYIWLKKYTFFPSGLFLHSPYLTLGLSYIFFRVLHLVIEADNSAANPAINFGQYLLYTLNFTTFVSGPIQRYDEFARDQFAGEPIALGPRVAGLQLERIVRGFFKVNVLAMLFNTLRVDAIASLDQPLPVADKMSAVFQIVVVYPLYLYCNFSGYIDIVIAMARLMRLRLPENFDRPFSTTSPLDFWNQWHMTLSNWLKTYVYNPLLLFLMRRITSVALEPLLGVICFFVTFFLIGVWHGRTSEFIFFGLLTGGGISIAKLWQIFLVRRLGRKGARALAGNEILKTFNRGLSYIWFSFTLLWFWGDWKLITRLFSSLSAGEWALVWLAAWLAAAAVLGFWEWVLPRLLSIRTSEGPVLTSRYALVVYASAMGLAAVVLIVLLNQPAPEIVYKAF